MRWIAMNVVLATGDDKYLPICWRTVTVKFYFQAAGLNVVLGNWKLWLIFQKKSEPKERSRGKKSLLMKVWRLIFRSWLPLPISWYSKQEGANKLSHVFSLIPLSTSMMQCIYNFLSEGKWFCLLYLCNWF